MKTPFLLSLLLGMLMIAVTADVRAQEEPPVDPEIVKWLRIVEDPDGQTNVRSGPSAKAKVVGQVLSGGVVTVVPDESKDGWERLDDYTDDERYIHSSRLKKITSWKQIAAKNVGEEDTSATLKEAGAEIQVKAIPFEVKQHKVTKDKEGLVLKIDGGEVWGRDGDLPDNTIALTVKLGGQDVPLPKEALQYLYDPNLSTLALITPGDPAKHALVYMLNGDGAGAYCVVWAFENGGYRGRVTFAPF